MVDDRVDGNTTSVGIKRLGRDATTTASELGPLASLVGTWIGTGGWELMAVPDHETIFRLIVRPYVEVITFEALGAPVPNRGGPVPDLFVHGLMYTTRIADAETDEPLHLENGMWFYLGDSQPQPVARSASIPHGDSLLALGAYSTAAGSPLIESFSALPDPVPKMAGYGEGAYREPFTFGGVSFSPWEPQKVLTDVLTGQEIVETTTLSVSTANDGGIVNIPFVDKNANASSFRCDFWIETLRHPETKDEIMQLQYSQITNIEFFPVDEGSTQLVGWPHVNVATLHKQ